MASGSGALIGAVAGGPFGAAVGGLFGKKKGGGGPFVSGGADEAAYATQDFQEIFGRAPTAAELAQVIPAYTGTDQRIPNKAQGKAFVAQMFQAMENTPDKLYAKQQEGYLADAPKHFDAVTQLFQSNFGRAASQDELTHFGKALASGTTDSYQLQSFLQQQPEYTQKQDTAFQEKLSGQLAGYDKQYFGEQILPSIQETYAKQGRSFDSSGFQNAATQSAQQQNVQRQQFLGGLSAQQYGGRQQNAYQDYANQVAQQQNLMNSGIQAQYTGLQNAQTRGQNIQDFNTQSQLYNQYLAKYGKRNNPILSGLQGAIGGAMAGGQVGGVKGAIAGGFGGGILGGYGGSF